MRKYNNKTKRTIMIILVLFVVFVVIFSLFLKKSMDINKIAYEVAVGSILFDNEQNKITTTEEAIIKIKWGGDYYLVYQDENYNLGKHSVVYDSTSGDIYLYGKFYQVQKTGDVKVIKNENKLKSSVNSSFYKLEDRKYLIVDRTIEADTSSMVTSNYLMVNLDKSGNATLLNDKVSFKTITPTKLRTSSYVFDIANEKLNFGGEDIDLKKIIGSTNEYDEDTYDLNAEATTDEDGQNKTGSGTGSGSGDGTGSGGGIGENNGSGDVNGTGGGSSTGNGTGGVNSTGGNSQLGAGGINNGTTSDSSSSHNNNYDSGISDETVDEIIKATKNTSVIRIGSNINSISVDYVVYDPSNEYKSVYVEVENSNTGQINIVYLSKTDTNIIINDLIPNVYYNLTFKYTYLENGKTKEYTFDKFGIYTEIPLMTLSTTKIVGNKLYYKISLDGNYTIVGGTINLLLNGQIVATNSISAMGNTNEVSGNDCYFDISQLNLSKSQDYIFTLKLVSFSFNTYTVNPNLSYKFKY